MPSSTHDSEGGPAAGPSAALNFLTSKETTTINNHGTTDDRFSEWKETVESNHTTVIHPKDLDEILRLEGDCFNLPNAEMVAQFTRTLKELATSTVLGPPSSRSTSTVYGDLDEKTSLFGLFHCSKAPDETLTISYAISTLATQMSRKGVTTGIQEESFEMSNAWTSNYLASNVLEKLRGYGVNTRPSTAAPGDTSSGVGVLYNAWDYGRLALLKLIRSPWTWLKNRMMTIVGPPSILYPGNVPDSSKDDTSIDWPAIGAGGHDVPTDVVSSEPLSS